MYNQTSPVVSLPVLKWSGWTAWIANETKLGRMLVYMFSTPWWKQVWSTLASLKTLLTGSGVVFAQGHQYPMCILAFDIYSTVHLVTIAFVKGFEKISTNIFTSSSKLVHFPKTYFLGLRLGNETHCSSRLKIQFLRLTGRKAIVSSWYVWFSAIA